MVAWVYDSAMISGQEAILEKDLLMKRGSEMSASIRSILVLMALVIATEIPFSEKKAEACGNCYPGGWHVNVGVGRVGVAVSPGQVGVVVGGGGGGFYGGYRPYGWSHGAWRYGVGRYPLKAFPTPLRPWGGIAPVRQAFAYGGRGWQRRQVRWAVGFGGAGCRRMC